MMKLTIPNWLSTRFFVSLMAAFQQWWELVKTWVEWPLNQMDIMTCHVLFLDVIAYRRRIKRMKDEPSDLYRLRIATAYINAREAGTITGLRNIFSRLSIPIVDIKQKVEGEHWAVVKIEVTQDVASNYGELIKEIMANYGKLCRSYHLTVVSPVHLYFKTSNFQHSSNTIISR